MGARCRNIELQVLRLLTQHSDWSESLLAAATKKRDKDPSLNPELQLRRLFAAASTASRTLDSFSRSRSTQKRNPGRGNAGASQIGDLCLGETSPTLLKASIS